MEDRLGLRDVIWGITESINLLGEIMDIVGIMFKINQVFKIILLDLPVEDMTV